jgi:pimeloyl-ACP methyl ester carboxylesterase
MRNFNSELENYYTTVSTNLKKQTTNFETPFIFLTGRQDYNIVPALVEDYYNSINAPLKKMYWFENSAHFPHIEEPVLFQNIMVKKILPILKSKNKS